MAHGESVEALIAAKLDVATITQGRDGTSFGLQGHIVSIGMSDMPQPGTKAERLAMPFKGMVVHAMNRERLTCCLADRERAVDLGTLHGSGRPVRQT